MRVSPAQLSVLRMLPVARRIARAAPRDLAVFRVLNSCRGWDTHHTPVNDVAWALEQLHDRLPDLPVGLVGHSLGGRAALLAAHLPRVRSVVALNPYVLTQDRPDLDGRRVLVVHGDDDRIASPQRSIELVRRLPEDDSVALVTVTGARHAMLRRGRLFEQLAAQFSAATLLDDRAPRSSVLRDVLAGKRWVSV